MRIDDLSMTLWPRSVTFRICKISEALAVQRKVVGATPNSNPNTTTPIPTLLPTYNSLSSPPSRHNTNNILISNHVSQSDPLWDMSSTRAPNKRILKRILQRPMNRITYILHRALLSHNQCLPEIWIHSLPFRIHPNQSEFFPASLYDVRDTEIKLTGHDAGIGFPREFIEEIEGHGVDLVIYVEAFYIFAVVFHDDVYEIVYGDVLIPDEDFAVEDFVVPEDVVDHFLVDVFGWVLEGYFHAAGGFRF